MQKDFHYYATYCAARIAGYSHADGMEICYSAQLVDWCSRTFLSKLNGPRAAATTQLQLELMEARTDLIGLQDITRIWASFHFLPYDLHAEVRRATRQYRSKYRLLCGPNGALVSETVELAKKGGTQAVGIAMHVLADTWAHSGFAGTPSLVINNTDSWFYERIEEAGLEVDRPVRFRHSASKQDDLDEGIYSNSVYQWSENSIMNLGHGRAGHLPDYSFIRYRYLPAWGDYEEIVKDNPSEYYKAFCQMVYAMEYLKGSVPLFTLDTYATEAVAPWESEIRDILAKRQLDACEDWRALAERMAGQPVEDFDLEKYQAEYLSADHRGKDSTFLGAFFLAALAQKSMVTNAIFRSGNLLAGFSVDFAEKGFQGMRDFQKLLDYGKGEEKP
ncbi:MAG: hypothetical protein IJV40_13350 [Oscillospiraceae bacterium]|nr:hypothetical protein [Oscillospiraceae bacterium]